MLQVVMAGADTAVVVAIGAPVVEVLLGCNCPPAAPGHCKHISQEKRHANINCCIAVETYDARGGWFTAVQADGAAGAGKGLWCCGGPAAWCLSFSRSSTTGFSSSFSEDDVDGRPSSASRGSVWWLLAGCGEVECEKRTASLPIITLHDSGIGAGRGRRMLRTGTAI